jgi:hypothetical protein
MTKDSTGSANILQAIGHVAVIWNEAELVWFLIYIALTYQLPRPIAQAIFKRQTTGIAQRDLIASIAEAALDDERHKQALAYLNTAKTETNNLALERNAIVHGDYRLDFPKVFDANAEWRPILRVLPGDNRTRRSNVFSNQDLERVLPPLIQDIYALVRQLNDLRKYLICHFLPADHPSRWPASAALAGIPQEFLEPNAPVLPLIWAPIRPTARQQNSPLPQSSAE